MRFRFAIPILAVLSWLALPGLASADPVEAAAGKQPRVAIGSDNAVSLVYGRDDSVYLRRSTDNGATFGDEVKVGSLAGLMLGMRRGPRVAVSKEAIVVTAIARAADGEQGNVVMWRSTDSGETWSDATTLNRVPTSAREGMHDLAASGDGKFTCVWLDLRNGKTELWGTSSKDHGEEWDRDRQLYKSPGGTICECCHPSVSYDGRGQVWVMFRNVLNGARDMYVLKSRDGRRFGRAGKIGSGTWKLPACPMDGGSIVGMPDGTAMTVWRRDRDVYTAVPGEEEQRLDDGADPQAAAGKDGVHVIWLLGRMNAALRFRAAGSNDVQQLTARASSPTIAASGTNVVVAWEAGEKVFVTRVAAEDPDSGDGD